MPIKKIVLLSGIITSLLFFIFIVYLVVIDARVPDGFSIRTMFYSLAILAWGYITYALICKFKKLD